MLEGGVTPVTHRLHTSVLDLMWVRPCHMVTYRQIGHGGPRSGMDHQQDGMGFPVDVLFDFQHMYISRRGDTVSTPSLEINYSPHPLSPTLASSFTRPCLLLDIGGEPGARTHPWQPLRTYLS